MSGVQLERETTWLLQQWAKWAMSNPEVKRIYYPAVCSFAKMQANRSALRFVISDDEAMRIDNAIARLHRRDREMAEALTLYYWMNENLSATARVLGVNRKRADVLVAAGTAWVDGCIGFISIT